MVTPPHNVALSTGLRPFQSLSLCPLGSSSPSSLLHEAADHESPPPCCASAEQKTCKSTESPGSVEGGREVEEGGREGGREGDRNWLGTSERQAGS